jgi:hypothetical protein
VKLVPSHQIKTFAGNSLTVLNIVTSRALMHAPIIY